MKHFCLILLNFLSFLELKHVVINTHYLGKQIRDYVNKNQFNLKINLVYEKGKILDTGGGILNTIKYFSSEPFLVINPDTIWNSYYLKELKSMEALFLGNKKNKCSLLLVSKEEKF